MLRGPAWNQCQTVGHWQSAATPPLGAGFKRFCQTWSSRLLRNGTAGVGFAGAQLVITLAVTSPVDPTI